MSSAQIPDAPRQPHPASVGLNVAFAAAATGMFLLLSNMGHYSSYIYWPTLYRFPISVPGALWTPMLRVGLMSWGAALLITTCCWAANKKGAKSAGALLHAAHRAAVPLQFLWLYPFLFLLGQMPFMVRAFGPEIGRRLSPNLAWLLGFILAAALAAGLFGYHCPLGTGPGSEGPGDQAADRRPRISWKILAILGASCLTFVLLFSTLVILQYHAGHLGYADSGFVAEALWNTLHGRFMYAHGFDPPMLLADHFSPIWLLLVPIYALAPRHETLIVVSAVVLAVTAIPIFLFARQEWHNNAAALCLALAFLLHPAVQHEVSSFSYGFQAEVMAVPFLAFACYFLRRRSWKWFWVCVLLVLCCKETLAAIVLGLGLSAIVLERSRRTGPVVIALSVLWILGVTTVLLPWLKGGGRYYQLTQFFGHLGGSYSEISGSLADRFLGAPIETAGEVLHREVWMFLAQMLLPLVFLSLLCPAALLMGAPHFFMMLVGDPGKPHLFSIFHHYKVGLIVVPFFAAAVGVRLFLERRGSVYRALARLGSHALPGLVRLSARAGDEEPLTGLRAWLRALLVRLSPDLLRGWLDQPGTRSALLRGVASMVIIASLLSCYYFGPTPVSKTFEPKIVTLTPHSLALARMKRRIPMDACVVTTHRAGAHFTDREQLYCLPLSAALEPQIIHTADYILIDLKDRWGDVRGLNYRPLLDELRESSDYHLALRDRGFLLFEKNRAAGSFTDREQVYCLPVLPTVDPDAIYTADYILVDLVDRSHDKYYRPILRHVRDKVRNSQDYRHLVVRPILDELQRRRSYRLVIRDRRFLLFERIPGQTPSAGPR